MHFKKFGKYTIIKKLASGGMADILLANDLSPTGFGRFVVIKRALSKFSDNEEFKDMFKNEGKVACNLKHRNITPIYEFGIEKNQFFLSMEYISGRNLRELIKQLQVYKGSLSIPHAVHIIREVASGLNYAHNAIDSNTGQPLNLIHRDISPQNIMLSFDGEIKLIDFGIAKIADTNLTRAGHLKGKFSYMSPEQAHGEILDERTDIFCLGIILWELLTSKRLFASKNELASLKKIKNCEIPNAQKINPKVPTELNNIVKKALNKNKNARYKTAARLEQDLSVFLNKTYPEYSQYDFISFTKKIYRKKIMEERENLKKFSSEFKKYINTLNIEESLGSTMIDLNIPDLSTLVGTKSLTMQEKNFTKNEQNLSNSYQSQLATQTNNEISSLKSKNQPMGENSTTLIQRKENNTQTEQTLPEQTLPEQTQTERKITETKKSFTKTNPIKQNLQVASDGSVDLNLKENTLTDLIKNQKNYLQSTHSTLLTKSSSLYNKKELLYDELYNTTKSNKNKSLFILLSLAVLLVGFSFISYWIINEKDVIGLIKKPKSKQISPIHSTQKVKSLNSIKPALSNRDKPFTSFNTQNTAMNRKIFIRSNPSGAAIFINNKFSSKYTPSLITLTANKNLNITIKKEGYLPKSFTLDPREQKNNSLNVNLAVDQKRNISSEKIHIIQ